MLILLSGLVRQFGVAGEGTPKAEDWSPLLRTSPLCPSVNRRGPWLSLSIHGLAMLLCGKPLYKVKEF
jgi:hypothetical protein